MSKGKNLLLFLPAVAWYHLIWRMSAQTAAVSSGTSDGLLERLLRTLCPTYSAADAAVRLAAREVLSFYIRKGAHMFLYFVLALLVWLALFGLMQNRPRRVATTFLVCAILAAMDEYHQTMVPGRSGELRDVLVDSTGSLIALLLFALPFLAKRLRKTAYSDKLWLLGLLCGGGALVCAGQVNFAAQTDILLILRQAVYLVACAVSAFGTVCLAALSGKKKFMAFAAMASLFLTVIAAVIWSLPLLSGAALALLAGCAALCVRGLFPVLER